jgi:3-oxoacyl-[acyl-carrier-protein] synthase II
MVDEKLRRVVITGIGAITPIGYGVPEFWRGLTGGRSGAAEITHFDASSFSTRFACEVKGFDPTAALDRKLAQRLDRYGQFAIVAADEAVADAGLASASMPRERQARMGVIFGSGVGGMQTFETQMAQFASIGKVSPFFVPMMMANGAAGHIAIRHGLRGPSYAVVSACAAGNHNIGDALLLIRTGMADAIVAGSSEACITPLGIAGFSSMKGLSSRNDDPVRASRPFDAHRDGFVLGEGAGALVLESLEHAEARGARIYAEIIGYGLSTDAHHITAPDYEGIQLALTSAIASAGIAPEEIDYINAHSTSTPLGDVAEIRAIKGALGAHAAAVHVSSTKSMTGHLLGAAGAIEAVATVLALTHGVIPPTINVDELDAECDLDVTPNVAREASIRVAMSNAFGFGGHNTAVIMRKWEAAG